MEALSLFIGAGAAVAYSPEAGGAAVMLGAVLCLLIGAKPTSDE